MKILEKTQNKLVYQSEPNMGMYVFILIWGLGFGGIPLFIMLSTLTSSAVEALTCKRVEPTQVNCELTQSTYMGLKKERSISLSKVMGAKVNEETDSEGYTSYEIVILTQKGEVLLSNNNPYEASRINDFVKKSNTTDLRIDYDNRGNITGTLLITSLFMVIGLAGVGSSIYNMTVVETYIFDKTLDKLIHHRRSCLGTQVKEYTFLEIVDIRVEEKTDSDGDVSGYIISLFLTESKCLIFRTSFTKTNKEDAQELANTIANFLNLSNPK
jgi:hypothetical protein